MSTFGQLIDRTYREYLRPVEEQEPLTQVANLDSISGGLQGLTSSGTTLQYKEGLYTRRRRAYWCRFCIRNRSRTFNG